MAKTRKTTTQKDKRKKAAFQEEVVQEQVSEEAIVTENVEGNAQEPAAEVKPKEPARSNIIYKFPQRVATVEAGIITELKKE